TASSLYAPSLHDALPILEDKVLCQSAGLSAVEGMPVSENAVLACREVGVDIAEHTARRITGEELPVWDLYFPMSKTHGYILEQRSEAHTSELQSRSDLVC